MKKLNNGLQLAQEHAANKNGKLISTTYINVDSHLEWKCHNVEHPSWKASLYNVSKRNSWCPKCGLEKLSKSLAIDGLTLAKKHAANKKGQCLSTEYKNARTIMEWKCHNPQHKSWKRIFKDIMYKDVWCPHCLKEENDKKRSDKNLEMAYEHAKLKNGKCLSKLYINSETPLEWKCKKIEHKSWKASLYSIIHLKSWCPQCGQYSNLQEFRVQKILNYIFDTEFIRVKNLDWNKNPKTNKFLELDGYCNKLKIAFEYQGIQHYEPKFGYSEEDLLELKYRDEIKKKNCSENNVKLLVIEKIGTASKKNKYYDIFMHEVYKAIGQVGIVINKVLDENKIKEILDSSPNHDQQQLFLQKAKDYAASKNGVLLSTKYINAIEKLEWKCHNPKHKSFFSSYNAITTTKRWCRYCSFERRYGRVKEE